MHAFDRQTVGRTDRQTDRNLIARPPLHSMQRGKINAWISETFLNFTQSVFTALDGMQTRSYDEISVRMSVCPSVRLSNACIVTKRKKAMFRFLYHMKEHLS